MGVSVAELNGFRTLRLTSTKPENVVVIQNIWYHWYLRLYLQNNEHTPFVGNPGYSTDRVKVELGTKDLI